MFAKFEAQLICRWASEAARGCGLSVRANGECSGDEGNECECADHFRKLEMGNEEEVVELLT
jgi:hypothetical protein